MPPSGAASRGRRRADVPDRKRVYINCPYDPDYEPTFDAIVFATVCCGFIPCSALESDTVADVRIGRVLDGLAGARYSLHDLSRCHGEGDARLARFNMPLELGAAMALRHQSPTNYDWAVLVPQGHLYARFVSDLAGFDPLRYDGTPRSVVPKVMRWLTSRPDAIPTSVTPRDVLRAMPLFRHRKAELAAAWEGELPWGQLLKLAREAAGEVL